MCGAVQAMDSSMGGGGPLPELMSAGTPSSRRDAHEADCTPDTATRGQGGQMPPQPRRAEPLEGAHAMGPLFDAASAHVQGLRDAKALLDEGIFSEQESMREKETLLKECAERILQASWQLNPTNLVQEHTLFREARAGGGVAPGASGQ